MASFKTHITFGCALSGVAATSLLVARLASPSEVILYLMLGSVGSILPDIDSDHSIPIRIAFNLCAVIFAFFVMFSNGLAYSVAELLILWLASFIFVKYIVFSFFIKLTVHRGIIHSIPAAVMFSFIAIFILHSIFKYSPLVSWWGGFFVFTGVIIHLVLDEINSVNLLGAKIKKSFGTALKLGSTNDIKSTLLIYTFSGILFLYLPSYNKLLNLLKSTDFIQNIQFFPKGIWFAGIISQIWPSP